MTAFGKINGPLRVDCSSWPSAAFGERRGWRRGFLMGRPYAGVAGGRVGDGAAGSNVRGRLQELQEYAKTFQRVGVTSAPHLFVYGVPSLCAYPPSFGSKTMSM